MRVVILTTSYPRADGDAGGHFVATQARLLADEGQHVQVIAPGRQHTVEVRDGVEIHWVGGATAFGVPGVMARLRASPFGAGLDLLRTSRAFREKRDQLIGGAEGAPERVLAHWLVPSVCPGLMGLSYGGRVEAFAHGGDVRLLLALPAPLRELALREIARRVTSLCFASHSLAEALLGAGTEPRLVQELEALASVAAPPIELTPELRNREARAAERILWRARFGIPDDELLVVTMGRLIESKRVDLAMEAVSRAGRSHLVVVGEGPLRKKLQSDAARLGGRVRFLGTLERTRALHLLGSSDVLLHPSELEAAPTVVREARFLGVPVIACGAGDIARWSLSDSEIRCVARDAGSLACELQRLTAAGHSV